MASVSSKTVRVLEIPQEVEKSEFLAAARRLSSKDFEGGWLSKVQPGDENPVTSFARQYDGHVGTITLPSEKHKVEALDNHATDWRFDDKFNGVTVLFSPQEPDVEYTALLDTCLVWFKIPHRTSRSLQDFVIFHFWSTWQGLCIRFNQNRRSLQIANRCLAYVLSMA